MASLALRFYFRVVKSERDRKNSTAQAHYSFNFFPTRSKKVENILGDGGGFNDDGPPPDYRPGRWLFFPTEALDVLFRYDLKWDKPEEIRLFPKNWYEDEQLALAWNAIVGKLKKERIAHEVRQFIHTTFYNIFIFVCVYIRNIMPKYLLLLYRPTLEQTVDVTGHVIARPLSIQKR